MSVWQKLFGWRKKERKDALVWELCEKEDARRGGYGDYIDICVRGYKRRFRETNVDCARACVNMYVGFDNLLLCFDACEKEQQELFKQNRIEKD